MCVCHNVSLTAEGEPLSTLTGTKATGQALKNGGRSFILVFRDIPRPQPHRPNIPGPADPPIPAPTQTDPEQTHTYTHGRKDVFGLSESQHNGARPRLHKEGRDDEDEAGKEGDEEVVVMGTTYSGIGGDRGTQFGIGVAAVEGGVGRCGRDATLTGNVGRITDLHPQGTPRLDLVFGRPQDHFGRRDVAFTALGIGIGPSVL